MKEAENEKASAALSQIITVTVELPSISLKLNEITIDSLSTLI